jgi:hypothetical protein
MNSPLSKNIFFLGLFFQMLFAANTIEQTIQSAEIVINAFTGVEFRAGIDEHQHLTPHLHEVTLHGYGLPDDIKDQLKAIGFNFSSEFVSRGTTNNERSEGVGLDQYHDFGIFRFHYTLTGTHSVDNQDENGNSIPDYIDQTVETFTQVYYMEINEMGYYRPPGDGWLPGENDNGGSGAYDIYIRNISSNYYGYVQSEYIAQNTGNNENSPGVTEINAFTSYMVMRNNYSGFYSSNNSYGPTTELEAMQVTAAHEFFHAIQYGYDGREKPWLLEATAVWMEEVVYDNINDCYQYMLNWFSSPQTSLDASGSHWYGSYIFFKYIDEHFGGATTIRYIFEEGVNTNSQNGNYSIRAIDDGLQYVNSSFEEVLNNMVIANRVMSLNPGADAAMYSYEEAENYPVDGPDSYRIVNFSAGDTVTTTSTNLQKYASQYIKVNTETPVKITLTNIAGPREDLNLHSISEDYSGNFIIQTAYPIIIDPAGYSSIYVSVVSQNNVGSDWNYELSVTSLASPLSIYPGDTDNNGIVDVLDVLPIGVYFFESGTQRETGFVWSAYNVYPWETTPATYADANGDGVINEEDIIGIGVNWGNTHEVSGETYIIDPYDKTLLNNHRSAFQEIYNSLSGEGEAIEAIRELLRSVLGIHIPEVFSLHQNYPNPFNPTTTIQFDLPTDESISLTIYDILGRTVIELVKNINYQAGTYNIVFDGSPLSSGVHFYILQAGRYHKIRKMLVIK